MKTHLAVTCLLATVIVAVQSCKKPEETPDEPTPPNNPTTGTLKINFNANYDGAPFAFFTDYNTVENLRIRIETLKFLVTDFWAENSAGDSVYLKEAFKYNFAVNSTSVTMTANPGSYNGIGFAMGVGPTKNHLDPAIYPTDHALGSIVSNDLHWTWATGYIFTMFEGKADTTTTGTGPLNVVFAFHTGDDTLFSPLPMFPKPFSITAGSTTEINVDVDVKKFLSNTSDTIDLRVDKFTHTMDNLPLAVRFTNLFKQAISVP